MQIQWKDDKLVFTAESAVEANALAEFHSGVTWDAETLTLTIQKVKGDGAIKIVTEDEEAPLVDPPQPEQPPQPVSPEFSIDLASPDSGVIMVIGENEQAVTLLENLDTGLEYANGTLTILKDAIPILGQVLGYVQAVMETIPAPETGAPPTQPPGQGDPNKVG